eukprot:TRINITY_DN5983_c0_g2_i1.p1 TRINITY_DN5983_c0_g2~~TRINITY_DN5983_c0_g2_i1.p1  ORF type:complete len:197 (-),score=25.03 TRINITY_DN5983_c0_g2_i1:318-908(-)
MAQDDSPCSDEAACEHLRTFAEQNCRNRISKRGFSIEELARKCRDSCSVPKMQVELTQQVQSLQRQLSSLRKENESLKQDLEQKEPVDDRTWLQSWYLHKGGRLKKRWIFLTLFPSATVTYLWYSRTDASSVCWRVLRRLVDWGQSWKSHAFAVTDDMSVMGPFVHFAAECVRTAQVKHTAFMDYVSQDGQWKTID